MSQDPAVPSDPAAPNAGPAPAPPQAAAVPAAAPAAAPAGRGARAGALVIAVLIVASLVLYFVGDRLTPSTSQARVQAFVVPVAAEVAGKVLAVHIRNNDEVQPGQPLFDIDPQPYRIALERARADLESVRSSVQGVGGRRSRRRGPRSRCPRPAATWPNATPAGWRSSTRRIPARSRCAASRSRRPRATRRAARCAAPGPTCARRRRPPAKRGDDNAQLRSAVAAVEKAELDLARTRVVAPARGVVTDLRTDVGHFAQPGAPVMTLIAMHDLWISADLTENNIGHVNPGDPVAIVLDAMPGEVLKGRVRSIGGGVGSGQSTPPGTLPVVQNNRDWLRQAQRIPVAVEFDADVLPRLKTVRIGGQADVLVYTGDHPLMNPLGRVVHARRQLVHLPVLSDGMARGDKAALRLTIGLGLAVFVAYGLALQAPFVVCIMALLVLCKPGPPLPMVKAVVIAGVFAALVAAGVLMVPLLENYAAAGVLLTAALLFALFYLGRLRANPLTTVLVLAFTLIPVAGVQEQALIGVLAVTLGGRRARRRARSAPRRTPSSRIRRRRRPRRPAARARSARARAGSPGAAR